MITSRRSLLTSFAALVVAPAIVRVSSLMPVSVFKPTWQHRYLGLAQLKQEGMPCLFDAYDADLLDRQAWLEQRRAAIELLGVNVQ